MSTPTKQPLDVEEALKRKQQEAAAQSKPTFLTKKQREQLALERRQQQVAEQQRRQLEEQQTRDQFLKEAEQTDRRRDRGGRERERDAEREKRREERKERERQRELDRERNRDKDKHREKDHDKERDNRPETNGEQKKDDFRLPFEKEELELIKKDYLGQNRWKKKVRKASDKYKFLFDWEEDEDTSQDANPFYRQKQDIKPLFGRGYIAGVDKREQISDYKKFLRVQQGKTDDRVPDSMQSTLSNRLVAIQKAEQPEKGWKDKPLSEMTDRDWRIFKEEYDITTRGGNIPHPIRFWHESGLREELLEAIADVGYTDPTPIQRQAIPIGLSGRDVLGVAETGSGKTASFVLPMLEWILSLPKMTREQETEGPYALILAPTRELAQQIFVETKKFGDRCGIRVVSVVGGLSIEEQGNLIHKGCEVIVATPGRLTDLIDSRYLVLNQCTYVVLDEADRMIDMGFELQVNTILDFMPVSNLKSEDEDEAAQQEKYRGQFRTTTMYSATMPIGVERLSRKYLRRPAYVIIGEIGGAVDRIKQTILWVTDDGQKQRMLQKLLTEGPPPPVIVFISTKKMCDVIAKMVDKLGFLSVTLHSGKNQTQRETAIDGFRSGKYQVLIATDVASRGIDVPGVTHVINYDMPKSIEDYTHRIGRTGRAGMKGLATSFLSNDDVDIMFDLKNMLQAGGHAVPPELSKHEKAQYKPGTVAPRKARRDTIIFAK